MHRLNTSVAPPLLDRGLFAPGMRLAVGVSGGADSVCLLRLLADEQRSLGIVLSVAHVHHGLRGAEADADESFVRELAASLGLAFHLRRADVPSAASQEGEGIEEAARKLRYAYFDQLMSDGVADAVATAHTLDDQAETVLHKLLRGAWTEGLSGIHGTLKLAHGCVLRPLLAAQRGQIESWLEALGQPWREDATNRDLAFTRNRIRHELLPLLATFNPQIPQQLARLATVAGAEESYWSREMERLLPSLLLPGKPVRGGGRSISTHPDAAGVAVEIERLRSLHPAVVRRVLRAAARQLGGSSMPAAALSFEHTEALLEMCQLDQVRGRMEPGRRRLELPGVIAERSHRELRLSRPAPKPVASPARPEYTLSVPGEVVAPEFALRISVEPRPGYAAQPPLTLRGPRPGDRLTLNYSRGGAKPLKDVFERLHVHGADREGWPLVADGQRVVWMRGVDVDAPEFMFRAEPLS